MMLPYTRRALRPDSCFSDYGFLQGFEPANLERYAFRLRTSPALQAAAAPTVPASSALAAAPQPSAPVTGPGPAASAPAAAAAAAGTAGASGSGSGRQQRQRPTVPIDDLLTEEERAALAAVEGGKGKSGASSS